MSTDSVGTPAIFLYGFMSGSLGLGQAARLYAAALVAAGARVRTFDVRVGSGGLTCHATAGHAPEVEGGVNLVFVNPDHFAELLPLLAKRNGGVRRYTIGMWFWELPVIPDRWVAALALVDEIWVATSFIRSAFLARTEKPVTLIPPPIPRLQALAPPSRKEIGLPVGAIVFLFVFDFHSVRLRKNPEGVIDAFRAAFPGGGERAALLIKSSNGLAYPDELRSLLRRRAGDRRIIIRDEELDEGQMITLRSSCDVFVSLHRAEGLGLGILEFMAMGKPVIATNWSGNTDFMRDCNSLPIGYKLVPVAEGEYPGAKGAFWAEPDIAAAAQAMRRLVDVPGEALRIGSRAQEMVRADLDSRRIGEMMLQRLEKVAGAQ